MTVSTHTRAAWFPSYVRCLMSAIVEQEAQPDADGDFPISGHTSCRLGPSRRQRPWGVEVQIIAARGVPSRAAILQEINARERLGCLAPAEDG